MMSVENVNHVTKQLMQFATNLRKEIAEVIINIGNKTVEELKVNYPDLTITGQFFPDKIEYWLIISRLGEELTHIKCPVSNLYFTRKRDEFGNQEFKSTVPELDVDAIAKNIAEQLSLQLNAIVGRKVM